MGVRHGGRRQDHGRSPRRCRCSSRRAAWLTLDDTDAAAGRLVTYLEAALAAEVESAAGVATQALAARLPHAEAAGLLVEAVGDVPVVLVIDELERLEGAPDALAVIGAVARYAPSTLRVVLISRREVPIEMGSGAALGGSVTVAEADLAFRAEEAATALERAGRADIDPAEAVEATGGWVAGVLFEAWRSAEHVVGQGGEADALHGYLSSQILDQLDPGEREFLITTSLLDDVTAERAEALGEERAASSWCRCVRSICPWRGGRTAARCAAMRACGSTCSRWWSAAARPRCARCAPPTPSCWRARGCTRMPWRSSCAPGRPDRAMRPAERAIETVIDRLDYAMAEHWLSALADVPRPSGATLAVAELMLAIGREDYRRGGRVADRLHTGGRARPARAGVAPRRRDDGLELLAPGPLARHAHGRLGRRRQPRDGRGSLHAQPRGPRAGGGGLARAATQRQPARRPGDARALRARPPHDAGRLCCPPRAGPPR